MELRHLRFFVAVAEELSFTRAATRLFTSQPSLSEQIRNLELEIGFALLTRTRRKVELTPAGVVFLDEARQILGHVEMAVARAAKAASQRERITIGFVPAAEVRIFPSVLPIFRVSFPEVDIVLRSLTSEEQEVALARGEIELGFMRGPVRAANLHSEVVLVEQFRVYLPHDHPLVAAPSITPSQLDNLPAINIDPGYGRSIHDALAQYLARHDVTSGHVYPSSNPLMSINLVASGLGYTLLPAYAENFMPKDVVSRSLPSDAPTSELLMVSLHDIDANSGALNYLKHIVREAGRK
ncbi:LysR substrate-binding domain-containing protein [Pseudomonas sp. VEM90]